MAVDKQQLEAFRENKRWFMEISQHPLVAFLREQTPIQKLFDAAEGKKVELTGEDYKQFLYAIAAVMCPTDPADYYVWQDLDRLCFILRGLMLDIDDEDLARVAAALFHSISLKVQVIRFLFDCIYSDCEIRRSCKPS